MKLRRCWVHRMKRISRFELRRMIQRWLVQNGMVYSILPRTRRRISPSILSLMGRRRIERRTMGKREEVPVGELSQGYG